MKHVLLVVDGDIALHFVNKLSNEYSSNNFYIVVYRDDKFLPKRIPSTFKFYQCDYTSHFRLDNVLLNKEISDIFIIVNEELEGNAVYYYLRNKYKKSRIIRSIHSLEQRHEEVKRNDDNLLFIAETNVVASRLLFRVPNIPVIPRGFGLEQGELMEIGIPSGSIFAHREVSTIQQSGWKIVGIYRKGNFQLSSRRAIILPGDTILVAGEPKVTQTIYNQIRSDMGQFPSPFGRDICLIIDMKLQNNKTILYDCKEAIYIHRHLKSTRLTIKVIHATDFDLIKKIENFRQKDISVVIDYDNLDFTKTLSNKIDEKVGLIIVSNEIFSNRKYRYVLWDSKLPVFKIGKSPLHPTNYDYTLSKRNLYLKEKMLYPPNVAESLLVIAGDKKRDSNISTLIFDISRQLCLNVRAYDFDPDGHFSNIVEGEFNSLSRIFDRKFFIDRSNANNPILYIQKLQKPILHFIPFSFSITKSRLLAFMYTRFEAIAFMNNTNPQLFLPINENIK